MPRATKYNYILAVTHDYYNNDMKRSYITSYVGNLRDVTMFHPTDIYYKNYQTKADINMLSLIRKTMNDQPEIYIYGIPCKCIEGQGTSSGLTKHCKAEKHKCICYGENTDINCKAHNDSELINAPVENSKHPMYGITEKAIVYVLDQMPANVCDETIRRRINIQVLKHDRSRKIGYIINKTKGDTATTLKKQIEKQSEKGPNAPKYCECCGRNVSYAGWARHIKTDKHNKLFKEHNKMGIIIKSQK